MTVYSDEGRIAKENDRGAFVHPPWFGAGWSTFDGVRDSPHTSCCCGQDKNNEITKLQGMLAKLVPEPVARERHGVAVTRRPMEL
jgi:hypothetical protein